MQVNQAVTLAVVTGSYKASGKAASAAVAPTPSGVSQAAYKVEVSSQPPSRLDVVRARIASGYYNSEEVAEALAERLVGLM